ncbi:hypothetical protein [Paracoccus contaminans]|uniref:Uncharacterized protein n=1 Tax=Paracoccus contaminans TaxID=1945662 RepID=A0A1W6CVC2_9RHOB|nr:hypothetical protein [Paracoccus contaminans]ARJ68775.1 hypothetical protein B0A89_03130 [Paracoccus contaminans]
MSETFTSLGLKGGVWEGSLRGETPPTRIVLTLHGRTVAPVEISPQGPELWRVRAVLPADTLSDGAQTYMLIADDGDGTEAPRPGAVRLAKLPLLAGEALQEDLRAEIDLLRAEIDLIKREFRRLATG